ncbi:blastoderm-specific protein 25D-like isoform X2 [Leptidea sinapis]|uniref:blastoderm-specific protein 25D-like isoform X2 n=1 Tax=Leptidea sinapis TaxID=189913 RepID=UPI0021314618|nr:blastoderm-specific protein 25D-like isoform X2 [Leptidea sinapis]
MKSCTMYKITYVARKKKLEEQGSALVDSLFEQRSSRVTFTQFRNGLLSVIGGEGQSTAPAPRSPTSPNNCCSSPIHSAADGVLSRTTLQSDDDSSSGRECVPRVTFGSKKYGRRSRPSKISCEDSPRHRVASESRLHNARNKQHFKYKRSSSAMETRSDSLQDNLQGSHLEHNQNVDRIQALALCRGLNMHGVDQNFVDRVFEDSKSEQITVGMFFDRLNASLQSSIDSTLDMSVSSSEECLDMEYTMSDVIVQAWERVGVPKPQRLLNDLGFSAVGIQLQDLERCLDDELQALNSSSIISDPQSLLLLASHTVAQLRLEKIKIKLEIALGERDKLRLDLKEANKRSRMLAQDVDENHAKIEAELKASLQQLEARHADIVKAVTAEASVEREHATSLRQKLEAEIACRTDLENRLKTELTTFSERQQELEERVKEADCRVSQTEKECSRIVRETQLAAEQSSMLLEDERGRSAELNSRLQELIMENQKLRDRNDELCAELESAAKSTVGPVYSEAACWREETAVAPSPTHSTPLSQRGSFMSDDESKCKHDAERILQVIAEKLRSLPVAAEDVSRCARCDAVCELQVMVGRELPADLVRSWDTDLSTANAIDSEKENLKSLVKELELSLEQLREEYERCEEYWAGKVRADRERYEAEQRADDERLAQLADKIASYERQFAPAPPESSALPALPESALEEQYLQLETESRAQRAAAEHQLRCKNEEIENLKKIIQEAEQRLIDLEQQHKQQQQQQQQHQQQQQQHQQKQHRTTPRHFTIVDELQHVHMMAGGTAGAARCACACGGGGAGGGGLRARAVRAERAAARLHARLAAADLLVKDLYIENCRLAHMPHAP